MISTTAQLKEELLIRINREGLKCDCPSDGTFNSNLAIVAEAPGEMECLKKLPLVGSSGTLLWQGLRRFQITRMECYITNFCKTRLAFAGTKKTMTRPEQSQWSDILLWELDQLPNLKYVLVMGNYPLQCLTGRSGITFWRGSVLEVSLPSGRSITCICTFNAAAVIHEPKYELAFTFDLNKLRRVLDGKHRVPEIDAHINPSYSDAREWINKVRQDGKHGLPCSLDIEVISGETACVGLSTSPNEGMCINFRDMEHQRYTIAQERNLRLELQRLVKDKDTRLIMQKGMFDATWLWYKDGIKIERFWFDTLLAHHLLYPTLPHNLGFITTQYTDQPNYKNEKDQWREGGDIDDFWRYNVKDVCITHAVTIPMQNELRKAGLEQFFFDHVMKLQPHLTRMTVGGVLTDVALKDEIRQKVAEDVALKLHEFHTAVQDATGDKSYEPNPKSSTQLSQLLFNKLRLVGRGTSVDAANRERMRSHVGTPAKSKRILNCLDEFLEDHKFLSTYAEARVDEDNRFRCEYKQEGVQSAPGRLSSTGVLWGSGGNLQNQPERAYPMYIADPGFALGYLDGSQAEARLVAYFANIPSWKEQFERARIDGSYDAHCALASEMFGIPYNEVPSYDRYDSSKGHVPPVGKRELEITVRYVAKRCRHGLNYRMGPERLAQTTGLSSAEAYKAYNLYHRSTPEIKQWWDRLEGEVRKTRMLYNALGRRWVLLERLTPDALESIVAFKPQSTLGDHVCRAITLSEEDDDWPTDARMLLNIHDALICLAPIAKVKKCLAIMKKHMEMPIRISGEDLIIPAECGVSQPDAKGVHRWSTIQKVKSLDEIKIPQHEDVVRVRQHGIRGSNELSSDLVVPYP